MDTDPNKPAERPAALDDDTDPKPLVPKIEDGDKVAENIREKGEPFDGNLA